MQDKNFISYEYATKTVKNKDHSRVVDMSEAFGWEVTETSPAVLDSVTISLKRDRKQRHRQELTKLERQADQVYSVIDNLEKSKTRGASIFAYIFGCIAALVLGGGMSLVMLIENSLPAMIGGIILGIFGLALCGINYLIYLKLVESRTKKVLPLIDENEEKLADILQKGNDLLSADII